MTSVQSGILLGGKYRLEEPIGKGGMGWVWKAQQIHWGAPVAVKLIEPKPSLGSERLLAQDSDQRMRRFLVEARAAAAIRSPHVVQILDHGIDTDRNWAFIVMELLDGETLEAKLERQGRLSPPETVRIMLQVAKALSRVHEAALVHRDLKPSNIFLVRNDGEDVVKLLDFGIAKAASDGFEQRPITSTGQQLGTPVYMSPEQIRGMPDVDFRTDLWAFGVIAYECLVGARPFSGETLGDLSLKICAEPIPRPSRSAPLPPEFDDWFDRCVNRERQLTFGSAREAAERLELAFERTSTTPSVVRGVQTSSTLPPSAFDSTTIANPTTDEFVSTPSRRAPWRVIAIALTLFAAVSLVVAMRGGFATDAPTVAPSSPVASDVRGSSSVASLPAAPHDLPREPPPPHARVAVLAGEVDLRSPPASSAPRPSSSAGLTPTSAAVTVPSTDAGKRTRLQRRSVSQPHGAAPTAPAPVNSPHDLIEDRY